MSNRSYVVGFVCGVLAIAAAAGCATQRNQIKPAAMQPAGASGLASIAGVWEGEVWEQAPAVVEAAVREVVAPYGVSVEVAYTRGVPPVVNEATSIAILGAAASAAVGPESTFETEQSLGGEDFAWYLGRVPGALARLGVRRPEDRTAHDLHQGSFDVDERCIAVGVRLLTAAALLAAGSSQFGSGSG